MSQKLQPDCPIPADRLQNVLSSVRERGSVPIRDLAAQFHVSESTIRRDLDGLAARGLVRRTHGGAMALQGKSMLERVYDEKMGLQLEEKRRIAAAAARSVSPGDVIFLDSGTTAYQLALCLAEKKGLTVITHDLCLAANVEFDPTTTVVLTGGLKRANQRVLIGGMVEDFISRLRVDLAFLTADAVSADFGVSNTGFFEVGIKQNIVRAGKRVVLLADHTKFGEAAPVQVCPLSQIDWIITDRGLPREVRERLESQGVKLELA